MIHLAWPWMLICLPLPWLASRLLPPASPQGGAVFLPFAAALSGQASLAPQLSSRFRALLLALVWVCLIAAALRPQWLGEPQAIPTTGRALMLAVDTSGSMATPDMAGGASRLRVVQAVAGDFIAHRHGDQVGLILFGTRPYLQAPLTADLHTVGQFLDEAMIGIAGPQTAIGDAIGLAINRLNAERAATGGKAEQVLVLLTDGANDAGLMDPISAAKAAASAGLRIYTIGVGAPVEQDSFGDSAGNTDLDEPTLKQIAQLTGGQYFRATDADALQQVYARIDQLEPSTGHEQWYRPSSEWFYWPLGLALLLSVPAVMLRRRT
jgi:Ca-activated chloride channel family protein